MRPRELTLKGFRSYRGETTFDFTGRRLVGIVGPIGAGKSSILDAVAFALYGKTPTYERDTKSLIHQQAGACHVSLQFEVDGQLWRAVRSLRRKGASGHQLLRLDPADHTAPPIEDVQGEKPMRARIERLLGMEFNAFCRSVLLAQGRFADFLRATERDRNEVLKGVFGYERFDAALEGAKRRVSAEKLLLESFEREGGALAEARAALVLAQTRLAEAAAWLERIEAARPKIDAAEASGRAAVARLTRAREEAGTLTKAADALPARDAIEATVTAALEGTERLAAATTEADAAEAARKDAEAALTALAERVGDESDFTELVRTHDRHVETLRVAEGAFVRTTEALETATTAAAAATQAQRLAAAALKAADAETMAADAAALDTEEALHAARHHDMARTLRADLAAGAPCPVCEQTVTSVPKAGRAPAIAGAEKALDAARTAAAGAQERRKAAAAEAATTVERLDAAEIKVRELQDARTFGETALRAAEADLDAVKSEVIDRLGEGDPHALMQERRDMLAAGAAAREAATEQATAAREQLERVREAGASAQQALTGLATKLATVWGILGDAREVGVAPQELRKAFVEIGETLLARHEQAEEERTLATAETEAAARDLAALLDALDVDPGTDFAMVLATASAARAGAQAQVEGLQTTIEAGADIDARMAEAQRVLDVATRLASDLQPSNFLGFLLGEERAALAALGSHHLEDLTDGGYRFTDDDAFDVLDLNAGGTMRRADSLSGGETFLASLALALALAEMVARGGGRLDALFLDEGFGSLDPEHLDRAMDGVGRLVAGDRARLVVLVSHVEQMRETMEDLIVLDKDDLTGDTVVVSGALPAERRRPL